MVFVEVGMSKSTLEDAVLDRLGQQMEASINFEILADVLTRFGWYQFKLDYHAPLQTWQQVMNWVDQNCSGDHREHSGTWLFELEKDATMFALKWL